MENEFSKILIDRISLTRLTSFLEVTNQDLQKAISLYEWNAHMSAAMFETLGHLEVVLRNAMNTELSSWHSSKYGTNNWLENKHGFLLPKAIDDVHIALSRLNRKNIPLTSDGLVSELNFGFWRFLLTKHYRSTLWPMALRFSFSNLASNDVSELSLRVTRLHELRNRVAHHEPIHRRKLARDLADIKFVIGSICSVTESWMMLNSRANLVLENRPF